MNSYDKVALMRCNTYDSSHIYDKISEGFSLAGITEELIRGKKVAIKPNLLLAYAPEKAATSHPTVIEAAARLAYDMGAAEVIIAESPGGIYTPASLRMVYKSCGMNEAAEKSGAKLNFDVSSSDIHYPDGITSKSFQIIDPLWNADVIINVCKLKTHNLAVLTCAAKNLFGAVPGVTKFEMHARFKKPQEFFSMLVDLCTLICKDHTVLNICDAVIGMEGSGPSAGNPREIGALLVSRSPFCLDTVAAEIANLSGRVGMLDIAAKRGLCPTSVSDVEVVGEDLKSMIIKDFAKPDTEKGKKFDLIPKFLQPRPVIDTKKCVGCEVCKKSCPVQTINMVNKKARIIAKNCIKCYCCHELCKFKAVKIKKSVIYKIFK